MVTQVFLKKMDSEIALRRFFKIMLSEYGYDDRFQPEFFSDENPQSLLLDIYNATDVNTVREKIASVAKYIINTKTDNAVVTKYAKKYMKYRSEIMAAIKKVDLTNNAKKEESIYDFDTLLLTIGRRESHSEE